MGITSNNFAAALGLPQELHGEEPHKVHRLWQLRRAQFLFLQEEADEATAVRLWDEQHEFVVLSFILLLASLLTSKGPFPTVRSTRSLTRWCSRGRREGKAC